jgi:hypothetical protein
MEGEVVEGKGGGYHPEFVQMVEEFQAFNDRMLDFYVDMGLIVKDQKKKFQERNKDYVPFQRVLDQLAMPPSDAAQASIGQRLYGGPENVKDIGANIIDGLFANVRAASTSYAMNMLFTDIAHSQDGGDFADTINADVHRIDVEKAQMVVAIAGAMKAVGLGISEGGIIVSDDNAAVITDMEEIAKAIDENPMLASFWTFGHKPRVSNGYVQGAIVDGKWQWFQVKDALLVDMLTAMGPVRGGTVLNIFWAGKNFMTHTVTSTLQFLPGNAVRDTSSGYAISRNKFIPVISSLIGMGHVLAKTELYWDHMRNRGGYGTRIQARTESTRARRKLDLPAQNGFDVLAKSLAGWDRFTSVFELGSRVGDYRLGLKREWWRTKSKNQGISQAEASWQSRDITTDFGKHGNAEMWVKFMRTVPFLNAGIQGLDKTGRIISTKDGILGARQTLSLDKQKRMFLAKVSVFPVVSAILFFIYQDEEWYQDLPIHERSRFWHYKFPWMDRPGRIQKPYDIAVFPNMTEAALWYIKDKDGAETARLMAWSLINTLGIGDYPGLVQPYYEHMINEKFTGAPVVPEYMKRSVEPRFQFKARTPILYRAIGTATGISPLVAEHYSKGILRYVEQYMVDAVETIYWDEEKHGERPFARKPVDYLTNQFMGRKVPYQTKYTDQYWDLKDRAGRAGGTLRHLMSDIPRDKAPALKYASDKMNKTLNFMSKKFAIIDKGLSEKRKIINLHWFNSKLSAKEKENKINKIQTEINAAHKNNYLKAEKLLEEAERLSLAAEKLKLKLQGEPN